MMFETERAAIRPRSPCFTSMALLSMSFPTITAAAGTAQPVPEKRLSLPLEGVQTQPSWRNKPDPADISREYPPIARLIAMPGRVVLRCAAEPTGAVDACDVISETPGGLGFGAAAQRISKTFAMKPATFNGEAVRGVVTIPIAFSGLEAPSVVPGLSTAGIPERKLQLAREIVQLEGVPKDIRAGVDTMLGQFDAGLATDGGPLTRVAGEAIAKGARSAGDDLAEQKAIMFAQTQNEAELSSTLAFLQTSAGSKYVQAGRSFGKTAPAELMQRIAVASRISLCSQIDCGLPNNPR